ncbi:hypothetical protein [Nocardioides sp. SYSU D00038]|uniref:hypothetical protein n=1 Tax=Nocardioides sp. SYSU D00038 TaxID=2812554 RepID=UPI0019676D4D|nr:hypothetical protein [Nocardioides sp. SYSU D00038]
MPKFDLKSEATRTFYAGAGVADLAVEAVKEYVVDVQKRVTDVQKDVTRTITSVDLKPQALREQAVTVVNSRVEAISEDAKARRSAVEARVADLQEQAKALPTKVTSYVATNLGTASSAYADLAKRGEQAVKTYRGQAAGVLDEIADDVEDSIEAVASVVDAPKTPAASRSAARTATSGAAPRKAASKPAAKKAPAKKATAKKAPAKKAATSK